MSITSAQRASSILSPPLLASGIADFYSVGYDGAACPLAMRATLPLVTNWVWRQSCGPNYFERQRSAPLHSTLRGWCTPRAFEVWVA